MSVKTANTNRLHGPRVGTELPKREIVKKTLARRISRSRTSIRVVDDKKDGGRGPEVMIGSGLACSKDQPRLCWSVSA